MLTNEEMAEVFTKAAEVERSLGYGYGSPGMHCGSTPKCMEGAVAHVLKQERTKERLRHYSMWRMRSFYPELYVVMNRVIERETDEKQEPCHWSDMLETEFSREEATDRVATMLEYCAKEVSQ